MVPSQSSYPDSGQKMIPQPEWLQSCCPERQSCDRYAVLLYERANCHEKRKSLHMPILNVNPSSLDPHNTAVERSNQNSQQHRIIQDRTDSCSILDRSFNTLIPGLSKARAFLLIGRHSLKRWRCIQYRPKLIVIVVVNIHDILLVLAHFDRA